MKALNKWYTVIGFSAILLTGCGEDAATVEHNRQMEILKQEQEFQLKMKALEHGHSVPSVTQSASTGDQHEGSYADSSQTEYQGGGSSPSYDGSGDSGYSGGDMVLGALTGALAGYAMSEMLDNGYRTATNSSGRTIYIDGAGKEVSQSDYNKAKKTYGVKQKAKDFGKKAVDKTKQVASTVKEKAAPVVAKAKDKAKAGYEAAKTKAAPVVQKAKEKTKQAAGKTKQVYRDTVKPAAKKAYRSSKSQFKRAERKVRNSYRSSRRSGRR